MQSAPSMIFWGTVNYSARNGGFYGAKPRCFPCASAYSLFQVMRGDCVTPIECAFGSVTMVVCDGRYV